MRQIVFALPEVIVRSVNAHESDGLSRHSVIDVFAVERQARVAENVFECLYDRFVLGREKNFIALPLLKLLDDDTCSKFYGGGIG